MLWSLMSLYLWHQTLLVIHLKFLWCLCRMDAQRVERPEMDKLIINKCIWTSRAQRMSCEENERQHQYVYD